ncbi:Hypothetical protein HDN1F_22620 [gamma proteobacterium HdN1]|nr:Hypothetical protein HDN1F_22620 [gamma proteobacterium HdN1]
MLDMKTTLSVIAAAVFAISGNMEANAATDYAKTRYPIVMVHGLTGAKSMLGVVPYWYGIPQKLKASGNDQVYVATVSAVAGEDIRAAQLEQFVAEVVEKTGAEKVNLIGHSQGGFTVRAYSALHPERVASLTTIGTPNHGTPVANAIFDINAGVGKVAPGLRNAIVWLVESFGWLNGKLNNEALPQGAMGALNLMTYDGAQAFARNVSDAGFNADCKGQRETSASGEIQNQDGSVTSWSFPVYSWTGAGAPVNPFRSGMDILDPSSYGMATLSAALSTFTDAGKNDGMVPVCSARLGDVISEKYYWSHVDEVNQIMGMTPPGDVRTVFVVHANRLKQLGL